MGIFLFLFAAAFLAGFIDSIAGGGGLISLPALLAANVPAHIALGTNKFQSMFGTLFALLNFTRKKKVVWKIAAFGVPLALIGSAVGAKLILILSSQIAAKIIIVLLPPISIFVIFSRLFLKARDDHHTSTLHLYILTPIICFSIGVYDGFLGPGTGSFLIVALVFISGLKFVNASATAKTFNLASNIGAFVTFLISGSFYLTYGLIMAGANILGNIVGSHFAIKKGDVFVRRTLLISLSILFMYLVWKYYV